MSIPSFVASSTGGGINTTVAVSKPTGTADGDLLLAAIFVGNPYPAPTVPGGYVLVGQNTYRGPTTYVYGKIASSEAASENWGATTGFVVIRQAWRPTSGSWSSVYHAVYATEHDHDAQKDNFNVIFNAMVQYSNMDMASISFFGTSRPDQPFNFPSGYTAAGVQSTPGGGFDNSAHPHGGGAYKLITNGTVAAHTWPNSGRSANGFHLAIIDPTTTRALGAYGSMGGMDGIFGTRMAATGPASLTVYLPMMKQGCLATVFVCSYNDVAGTPAGWTAQGSYSNSIGVRVQMFVKAITSDTPAWTDNPVFTLPSGVEALGYAYVWQPGAEIVAETGAADNVIDTAWSIPALTAPAKNSILLAICNRGRGDNWQTAYTAPTGYVKHKDHTYQSSADVPHGAIAWKTNTASNPAATSFTGNSSLTTTGMHVMVAYADVNPPISISQSGSGGNLNLGFTATAGRLLIAAMGIREWNRTFTPSGGWQIIAKRDNVDPGQMHGWILAKVATGGETAITGTFNGPGPVVTASVEVIGASINGALDGGWARGNTTTILAPTVIPLDGREAIIVGCLNGDNRNVTAGAGYTGVGGTFPPAGETDWPRVMLAYKIVSPATGSYTPQGTISPADEWTGVSAVFYQSITGTLARFSVIFIL